MIKDCAFSNNMAQPESNRLSKGIQTVASKGGAVAAENGGYGLSFVGCTFLGNSATNGGALYYNGNSVTEDIFLLNLGIFNISQVRWTGDYPDYAQRLGATDYDADYLSLAPYAEETTYMLRVDNSVFDSNTASSGAASASGGALHVDCGTALLLGSTFVRNSVREVGTSFDMLNSGGALFATNDCLTAAVDLLTTNVTVLDCAFDSNSAYGTGAAVASHSVVYPGSGLQGGTVQLSFASSTFTNNSGAQQGGALFLDMTSVATLRLCNFTYNTAMQGGAIHALGGAAQHVANNSIFKSNVATVGGAVYVAGSSVLATNACSFSSNQAANGSAIAVFSKSTKFVSTGDSFSSNAATSFGGAVFSLGSTVLSSPVFSNNAAQIGAAVFSSAAFTLPLLAGGLSNVARNYGPVGATLPANINLSYSNDISLPLTGASLTLKSGAAMNLTLHMVDLYSQRVAFWPDLTADVSCLNCGDTSSSIAPAISGNTNALYFSQSAAFKTLAVSGPVGSTAALYLKVASPSVPLFGAAGIAVSINVTIAPCDSLEIFQNQRCVCAPGAFFNSTSQQCHTCPSGSYSPAAGALACTVNPPGFASSLQTTFASNLTLAGLSASSFGMAQNTTLSSSIAMTLNISVTTVTVTAVTDLPVVGPVVGRRHLLQGPSATISFKVSTANAARLRSMLATNVSFSSALASALRISSDPVMRSVTGVAAGAVVESALMLPVLCPSNSVTSTGNAGVCACQADYYDALYGANPTGPICLVCPLGGVCNTGYVAAAAGWWREDTRTAVFHRCRVGVCLDENITGPLSATEHESLPPPGLPSDNCVESNTGPFCAVCKDGYALQSGECAPCAAKDAWDNWSQDSKGGLLVGCIVVGLVALAVAFLQPVWPALERAVDATLQAAVDGSRRAADSGSACYRRCCCRGPSLVEPSAAMDTKAAPPLHDAVARGVDATADKAGGITPVSVAPEAAAKTASSNHHHRTRRIDANAVDHSLASNAAFAIGNVAALVTEVDGGAEEDDTGAVQVVGVERQTDFMDRVEEVFLQFKAATKIFVNFFRKFHPRLSSPSCLHALIVASLRRDCIHVSEVAGCAMAQCVWGSNVTHFARQPESGGDTGSSLPSPFAIILQHVQRCVSLLGVSRAMRTYNP